jgi:hypothetical protein
VSVGHTQLAVFRRSVFTDLVTIPKGLSAGKTAQYLDIAMCVAASLAPLVREVGLTSLINCLLRGGVSSRIINNIYTYLTDIL